MAKSLDYLFAPMAKNAVTRDGVECSLVKTISSGRCIFLQRCLTGRPRRSETAATEKKRSRNNVPRALDFKYLYRYFLPARVYAISMVFFSWPPRFSYHSSII